MKNLFIALITFVSFGAFAQEKQIPSPPAMAMANVGDVHVMVKYAQPAVKGRLIFGTKEEKALVPYGEVWRTGANEATTIEFYKDVTVEGQKVAKGTYSLFTIPGKSEWTVILNSVAKQWGAYNYDASKDVIRFKVKPYSTEMTERLTFKVEKSGKVSVAWDKTGISFNVK